MGKRRATTADERAARRHQILSAATRLLETWSPDDVNMDRIADQAGIAKGTVYLYFRTREELFLEVFNRRHGRWLEALEKALDETGHDPTPDDIGRLIVTSLIERPLLLRLFGRLGSLVGGSVSPGAAHRFRQQRARRITLFSRSLNRRLPRVTVSQAERWMSRFEIFLAGLVQITHPARGTASGSQASDAGDLDIDFETELQYIAVTLLLNP